MGAIDLDAILARCKEKEPAHAPGTKDVQTLVDELRRVRREREEVGQRATELLIKCERLSVEADIVRAELHQARQERDQAIALNKAASLLLTKGWERKGEP